MKYPPVHVKGNRVSDILHSFKDHADRKISFLDKEINRVFDEYGTIPKQIEDERKFWKRQSNRANISLQCLELHDTVEEGKSNGGIRPTMG